MEFNIKHNMKGYEQLSFVIDLVKLTKTAKTRSFLNLSNCCKLPLKQSKACTCGKPVDEKSELKGFKMGKEIYPIPAATLEQIKKSLDSDIITISEFRDKSEIPELYYTDEIYAVEPHKKHAKELAEYTAVLKQANKVAVGMATIRSRPYPVMFGVQPGTDTIVMRSLHFVEEVDSLPAIAPMMYNQAKVSLLIQVMGLSKNEPFEIARFLNTREEAENRLIESSVNGIPIPTDTKVIETATQQNDDDEIKRLQELLAATTN